jgi:hypothetical protein
MEYKVMDISILKLLNLNPEPGTLNLEPIT